MKIILVGASGTIGSKVASALESEHELVRVGTKSGDVQADITDLESLKELFQQVGAFDALICAAGIGHFGPLQSMSSDDFHSGLHSKLLGQVNLVLIGQHTISPGGSFTLTSGILSDEPVPGGANLSAVNGALNSFVKAAALDLGKSARINAVSPGLVEDSKELLPLFPDATLVSMDHVVEAYRSSLFGKESGKVIRVWE